MLSTLTHSLTLSHDLFYLYMIIYMQSFFCLGAISTLQIQIVHQANQDSVIRGVQCML